MPLIGFKKSHDQEDQEQIEVPIRTEKLSLSKHFDSSDDSPVLKFPYAVSYRAAEGSLPANMKPWMVVCRSMAQKSYPRLGAVERRSWRNLILDEG